MIPFANPAAHEFERNLSPDFVDWPFLGGIFERLPESFRQPVGEKYKETFSDAGQFAANTWIRESVRDEITVEALNLASSDADVCEFAKRRAADVSAWMARQKTTTSEAMRAALLIHAERSGLVLPERVSLHGIVSRLTDVAFWRRNVRRNAGRVIERHAIGLGLVHRRAGIYASDETVGRREQQKRRNLAAMENTEAVNSEGEAFNLAELAALGVSNPSVRFAELMVRVRGMEAYARREGDVGLFCTMTAPSSMHARHSDDCRQNELFDGTTPKEAQGFLAGCWSRIRAAAARRKVKVYGVRVAEPHHDGTPHWHMLLFMDGAAVEVFCDLVRNYVIGKDADEARRKYGCDFKRIDWAQGSAAGYLVKYLAKNISGERCGDDLEASKPATETAGRVGAWAAVWGIRQFQVIGGPAVGVWRELRRLKEKPEQGELFPAWDAVGSKQEDKKPDWCAFMDAQGGVDIRRDERPVQVWKLQEPGRLTKYREEAPARVAGVVCAGRATATRETVWTIRAKREAVPVAGRGCAVAQQGNSRRPVRLPLGSGFDVARPQAAQPWTRVNNCTRTASPSAWNGLAANLAGWAEIGRKDVVGLIFEEMRRLKNAGSESRARSLE